MVEEGTGNFEERMISFNSGLNGIISRQKWEQEGKALLKNPEKRCAGLDQGVSCRGEVAKL